MFVLSYQGPNFTNVCAVIVADEDEATAYMQSLPEGSCGVRINTAVDLQVSGLSISLMTTLYNGLAEEPIKKFKDSTVARERLFAAVERAAKPVGEIPPVAEDTSSDVATGDTQPATENTGEIPAAEGGETENQEDDMAKAKSAKKTKAPKTPKAPKAPKEKKVRKPPFPEGSTITILAEKNPKRGAAAKRFDLYRNGMKVETAIEKGVTVADIRWDRDHKFIKIN